MTRNYGKKPTRQNFAGGGAAEGPFYDAFGDRMGPGGAHINRAGGITEGESPEERAKHYPGKVSKIACWSEDSTFNRPTKGYMPGALVSGGLFKGGLVKKPGKK